MISKIRQKQLRVSDLALLLVVFEAVVIGTVAITAASRRRRMRPAFMASVNTEYRYYN